LGDGTISTAKSKNKETLLERHTVQHHGAVQHQLIVIQHVDSTKWDTVDKNLYSMQGKSGTKANKKQESIVRFVSTASDKTTDNKSTTAARKKSTSCCASIHDTIRQAKKFSVKIVITSIITIFIITCSQQTVTNIK
jgi:hypothetical protein